MNRKNFNTFFLYFSIAATLLCHQSLAENGDWRVYSEEANGDLYFFDETRLESNSSVQLVWTRIRYKTSVMGASSYQGLLEINCDQRTEKILQRTFFSDRHWKRPAMSTDMKEKPKRPILKGSANERLSHILCK